MFNNKVVRTTLLSAAALFITSAAHAGGGVVVDVALSPAGDFKARTDDVVGEAVVQGDSVTAENIIVKLNNLKTGIALRDDHAKKKYLEVNKFPDVVLVKAVGKGGKGKGKIRIRGIEKDVAGSYKIDGGNLVADFPIKLSEFGITGIKYMGVGVNDDVVIHATVPVKK